MGTWYFFQGQSSLVGVAAFSSSEFWGFPHWRLGFRAAFSCGGLRAQGPPCYCPACPRLAPFISQSRALRSFPPRDCSHRERPLLFCREVAGESVVNSCVNGTLYEARTTDPLLRTLGTGEKTTRVSVPSQEQGLRFRNIQAFPQIGRLIHLTDLHITGCKTLGIQSKFGAHHVPKELMVLLGDRSKQELGDSMQTLPL